MFSHSMYPVEGCSIYEAEVTSVSEGAIEDVVADGKEVKSGRCIDVVCDEDFQMYDKDVPEFFSG